jgi:hypothetical protein
MARRAVPSRAVLAVLKVMAEYDGPAFTGVHTEPSGGFSSPLVNGQSVRWLAERGYVTVGGHRGNRVELTERGRTFVAELVAERHLRLAVTS